MVRPVSFRIEKENPGSLGRAGVLTTPHGEIKTPALSAVEKAGGVGKFMGFMGPTMTDSGGFQVFSLGAGFDKKVSKIISPQESPSQKVLGSAPPQPDRFVQEIPAPAVWDEDLATCHGKIAIGE